MYGNFVDNVKGEPSGFYIIKQLKQNYSPKTTCIDIG